MALKMIRLSGDHHEIGVQHGTQLKEVITNNVIPFVKAQMNTHGITEDTIKGIVKGYEALLMKDFPEVIKETRGLAEGAEIDYQTALLVLLFWEAKDSILAQPPTSSNTDCSSFVAAGDATVGGMPIATQNSDWPLIMHDKNLPQVFHVSPEGRYRFIGRGLAGNLGRTSVVGFNEEGLAFVGSGIAQARGGGFGMPALIATRIGAETCSNVDEFLDFVRKVPAWSHAGENVDVVDTSGNMARVGFTTKRVMIAQTKNHFVVSTNHYHHAEMSGFGSSDQELLKSTFARYPRIVELLWEKYGTVNREVVQSIMSDHKYGNKPPEGNNSICRHGETNVTLGNMISLPDIKEFWTSEGPPCKGKYTKYRL